MNNWFGLLLMFVLAGCTSSLTLQYHSEGPTAQARKTTNEQVFEKFEDLDEPSAQDILVSEDTLPVGLKMVEGKLISQKGYHHKVLGHFELTASRIANAGQFFLLPSAEKIKSGAKRVALAAGGDFIYIINMRVFGTNKVGGLTAWAVKLDPKIKAKFRAQSK